MAETLLDQCISAIKLPIDDVKRNGNKIVVFYRSQEIGEFEVFLAPLDYASNVTINPSTAELNSLKWESIFRDNLSNFEAFFADKFEEAFRITAGPKGTLYIRSDAGALLYSARAEWVNGKWTYQKL